MPELPEVETTIRALRPFIVGQTIVDFRTFWPRQIKNKTPAQFQHQIKDHAIIAISRRGKYIILSLDNDQSLIIHLRMSGHLSVVNQDEPIHKHDRAIFYLQNRKELRFRDQRKFGTVNLVKNAQDILSKLGPEPLSSTFIPDVLKAQLQGRRRPMKSLLLDQSFIAGIGNIYADEALFYAKIHPTRPANKITDAEIDALHFAIQKVLRLGIEREGASIDTYIKPDGTRGDMQNSVAVFHRNGAPCHTCSTVIQRIIVGGRSTHFCPNCQL
ncbi:MAG: DNA-formamidopyrimidine glycosylase [Chloroflexi bacterium]|nr:DNA-formamidopyrimidine glycosylase [Chloroflexota bacterium]